MGGPTDVPVDGLTLHPVDADGVLLAALDRGEDNLVSVEMCHALADLLDDPSPGLHVLRLRAAGPAFCLGRDRGGVDASVGQVRSEAAALARLTNALRRSRVVTVAEVQGDAAGFGVGLVAACDVSVAVRSASFRFPEVGLGLAPALVLAWLPRVVGRREAFWLAATGEPLGAERAAAHGLLNEVVDSAEALVARVDEMVGALTSRSARVHGDVKDLLRFFGDLDDEQAVDASLDKLVVGSLRRAEA